MWNFIMDNSQVFSILGFFVFAAILPFTGIVELGERLRKEIKEEEKEGEKHK